MHRISFLCISSFSESSWCITAAFKIFWKTYTKAAEDESVHVYRFLINSPAVKHTYMVRTGKQYMYTCKHVTMYTLHTAAENMNIT